MNFDLIKQYVDQGYISVRKHPTEELYIYNYTNSAVFDNFWPEEVMVCRGLIADKDNNIIARPFRKFFNYEDYILNSNRQLPMEVNFDNAFVGFEKLDGSLGILYFVGDKAFIATRGSFESEQAHKANKILQDRYREVVFDQGLTYLFEIIYPENRIVVDYKDEENLFLLAIIDTKTGEDIELRDIGFPLCDVVSFDCISKVIEFKESNKEGFVLKFANGFRIKIKLDEYKRLHKVLCCLSYKGIWECLKEDIAIPLEGVPDEFYDWVSSVESQLKVDYVKIEQHCKNDFKDLGDRKSNAQYYKSCQYPHILFVMLDNKNYNEMVWKLVKPKNHVTFRFGKHPSEFNSVKEINNFVEEKIGQKLEVKCIGDRDAKKDRELSCSRIVDTSSK